MSGASRSAPPSISTCFVRDLPPCATFTDDDGTSSHVATQELQRHVGSAVLRQRAHPRLEHSLPAKILDTGNLVAR